MVLTLKACAIFGANVSTTVETVRPPHGLRLKSDHIRLRSIYQTRLRAARGSRLVVLKVVEKHNLGERKALAAPLAGQGFLSFNPSTIFASMNEMFPQKRGLWKK